MRWIFAALVTVLLVASTEGAYAQSVSQVPSVDSAPAKEQSKGGEKGQQPTQENQARVSAPISQGPKKDGKKERGSWWDRFVAWVSEAQFTDLVLIVVTALMAGATYRIASHSSTIERGIVKMSHSPPGLQFRGQKAAVRIMVQNLGNTSARVTDVLLKTDFVVFGQAPTGRPDYSNGLRVASATAFLAKNDDFGTTFQISIPAAHKSAIQGRALTIYLYGYADYIDIFGRRFRTGYGRQYSLDADDSRHYTSQKEFLTRNNLLYLDNQHFNYDRRIWWWNRMWERLR